MSAYPKPWDASPEICVSTTSRLPETVRLSLRVERPNTSDHLREIRVTLTRTKAVALRAQLSHRIAEAGGAGDPVPALLAACKFAHSVITKNGVFEMSERLAVEQLEAAIAAATGSVEVVDAWP